VALSDYFSLVPKTTDKAAEDFLRQAGTYSTNRDVLKALGEPDTQKKAGEGLLSGMFRVLGVPGNLIRAGIAEGLGRPTPELAATQGLDQFLKIVKGELRVGAGDIPGLKVNPYDAFPTKALKLGAALVGDVATDPISYISAPGSLSRKAAATIIATKGADLTRDIRAIAPAFAPTKIDKLVEGTPLARIAKIQEDLGVPILAGQDTPAVLLQNPVVRQAVENEAVANHLSEGLIKGGRREMLRRMEDLTGSRGAALDLFKKLPEEVRGGVVVTGLLGKPVKRADGTYVRLTEGTGESLGKFGDVVNRARLNTSVAFNPLTRITGRGGDVYAEVKSALRRNEDELPGRDRFVDFVRTRNELNAKAEFRAALRGKAHAVTNLVANAAQKYGDVEPIVEDGVTKFIGTTAERKKFDLMFSEAFFRPYAVKQGADQIESDAIQAAAEYHKFLREIAETAKEYGVDLGDLEAKKQFTPLMMTKDTAEIVARTDRRRLASGEYSTVYGRDSFTQFVTDPATAARIGYTDANNPGVVYLDARSANELMKELKDPRRFEEDPTRIIANYATDLANRISNRRFIDALRKSGIVIQDVPVVRRLLNEEMRDTILAGLTNLSPVIRARFEEQATNARKALAEELDFDGLKEVQTKIAQARKDIKATFDSAEIELVNARAAYTKAVEQVRVLGPRANAISRRINQLRKDFLENQTNLSASEKAARSIRAKLGRAEVNMILERRDTRNYLRRLQRLRAKATTPEEISLIDENIALAQVDLEDAVARLDELAGQRNLTEQELAAARAERDQLVSTEAGTQVDATREYADAVIRMNEAEAAMMQARSVRMKARQDYKNVEFDLAIEKVDNIKTFVDEIHDKYMARVQIEADIKKLKTAGATADEIAARQADLKVARAAEVEARDTFREVLSYASRQFNGVARDYASSLLKAVDKLNDEEWEAMKFLTSEKKMLDYIEIVRTNARDSEAAMAAMQDMYNTWSNIYRKLGDGVFEDIATKQADLLRQANPSFIRNELEPSKLAKQITSDKQYDIINLNAATQDLYATKGVHRLMQQIYKLENDPTPFEKIMGDYLDPLLMLWKTAVTVGRGPGYVATNTIGGLFMNYLGNVSGKNMKLAGKALLRVNENLKAVEKANPNRSFSENLFEAEKLTSKQLGNVVINGKSLHEILVEFFARGAFFDTETQFTLQQVARGGSSVPVEAYRRTGAIQREFVTEPGSRAEQAYRDAINFMLTNRVQRALNNMAQGSEMYLRLGAFIDGFEKYGNFESAISNVHILHFNYQDLSEAEQWVRRFVPFYTWSRNNIPAQLRAAVMQPGKIQRAMYANQEFQNAFGAEGDESWYNQVLPEYINISDGFASSFKFGTNNVGFFLRLPFEDVNKIFQIKSGVITPRGRELANMLGPFTTPIEIASGVDLGTGAPFSEKGATVPEYYNIFRPVPGAGIYRDAEGNLRASSGFAKGLQDLIPQLGIAERAVSGLSAIPAAAGVEIPTWLVGAEQQKKSLADLLNVSGIAPAFGYSAATLTPQSMTGELRRRGERQYAAITRIAAQSGVDVDWVREQLRSGKTPETIAMLIQAGYGKAKKEQASSMQESTRQRYIQNLQGL